MAQRDTVDQVSATQIFLLIGPIVRWFMGFVDNYKNNISLNIIYQNIQ